MPDWKSLVRQRMVALKLRPGAQEDVIVELADHLEEAYDNARARGVNDSLALELAMQEVKDWPVLVARISCIKSEEGGMNNRTKALWLPAMANLTMSVALLAALELLGLRDRLYIVSHLTLGLPFPWLFALPASGATAAFLAKRAQAPLSARLIAGLAPSLVSLAAFCVMPLVFFLDRWQFSEFPLPLSYFTLSAVVWIVLPAFPLLLGTLPFLRESDLPKV